MPKQQPPKELSIDSTPAVSCQLMSPRSPLLALKQFGSTLKSNKLRLFFFRKPGTIPSTFLGLPISSNNWSILFSDLPPAEKDRNRRRCGGVAILWDRGAGLGHFSIKHIQSQPDDSHRSVFVEFGQVIFGSIYGPADKTCVPWFTSLFQALPSGKKNVFVGDYNWKPTYNNFLPENARLAAHQPTTMAGTAPTRAISNCDISQIKSSPLPGIKTHLGFLYDVHSFEPVQQPQLFRFRRCAEYAWGSRPATPSELQDIMDCVDYAHPSQSLAPLTTKWQLWHRRAEGAFQRAVQLGLAQVARKPERSKGSFASSLPMCNWGQA